jgi:hypothetical protein
MRVMRVRVGGNNRVISLLLPPTSSEGEGGGWG